MSGDTAREMELKCVRSLSRFVQAHPVAVIVVTILLTVLAALSATRITVSTAVRDFFPSTDPEILALDHIDEVFGGSDYVLIAARCDDVFTPEGLQVLQDITQSIEDIDGVHSVRSVTNMVEVQGTPWGLEVVDLLAEMPTDQSEANAVRRRMEENPQIAGVLLSGGGSYVLSLAQLAQGVDAGAVSGQIRTAIDQRRGDITFHLSGSPFLSKAAEEYLKDDLFKLFPFAVAVIVIVLALSFRTISGVLLPLVTVLLSIVWTLGLMGAIGVPLTQMSAVLPVVLLSSGSAYGLHMMHRYYEENGNGRVNGKAAGNANGNGSAGRALESVGIAIILAGVTTVAGFGSNVFSSMRRMREFGGLTAIGVGFALLIALTFLPAVLTVLDRRHGSKHSRIARAGSAPRGNNMAQGSRRFLERVGNYVLRKPLVVIIATIALVAWSAGGLSRLRVDTDFATFFDESSVARRDFDLIRTEFGGVDTIQVLVEGDILDPVTLNAMDRAQQDFQKGNGFGKAFSIVDVVKQVSLALHEDDPAWDRIPESREEVAQYLLLVSMSGDVGMDQMLSLDETQARIQVMVDSTVNSSSAGATLKQARSIVARNLEGVSTVDRVYLTGLPFLSESMGRQIMAGQMKSLLLAGIAVAAIVYFTLGRSLTSALCMVPIALTILANFGLMGWAGIPVNLVTALVSSIAVGIGIDYSIHVYNRYSEGLRGGLTPDEAIHVTISNTGIAVALNALSVAAGFMVMLASKFPPVRQFGTLIAVTMAVSATGALSLLPVTLLAASNWKLARAPGAKEQRAGGHQGTQKTGQRARGERV
jgi:hypothetical protein